MTEAPARLTDECELLRVALGSLREHVKRLEAAVPAAREHTMRIRHSMIDVSARVNAIQSTVGGLRMSGEQPQRPVQAAENELELFAGRGPVPQPEAQPVVEIWNGRGIGARPVRSLSPAEIEQMQASLHRAGDHTQDSKEDDAEEHGQ